MSGHEIAIPPQPDPAVEETSFAADVGKNGASRHDTPSALEEQPILNERSPLLPRNGQSSSTSSPAAPAKSSARALAPDLLRGLLMILMAMDHNALALRAFPHGTRTDAEADSEIVRGWNAPVPYIIRTFTHFCAPGFTFLLGMGVVYFGRSRANLGWSSGRMIHHFVVRAAALTALTVLFGLVMTGGTVWFMNMVLFALGVDYVIAGMLWIVISKTESSLTRGLLIVLPDTAKDDPDESLLENREGEEDIAPDRKIIRAANISWHLHNVLLIILALVTIWWNIWLSPTHGHCQPDDQDMAAESSWTDSAWFRVWLYPIMTERVESVIPPLPWLSFALLGLLYGRIILARSWSSAKIAASNALVGVAFMMFFVLTRLLRFGNLSEGCLRAPEQIQHPDANPYLVSAASFFYIVKYPPDVAFWAFSMSGNLLLLALFSVIPERRANLLKVLLVYGRSALFFYMVHFFFLFGIGTLLIAWFGHPTGVKDPFDNEPAIGLDEPWAFATTLAITLACMYPLCAWYGSFKQSRGPNSLWRFF